MRTTKDLRRTATLQDDGTVVIKDIPDASEVIQTAPVLNAILPSVSGTSIITTRGLQDHWIVLCPHITTSSGDACFGALSAWANTQSGRESFVLGSGGAVSAIASILNELDIMRLPSATTTNLTLASSGGNSNYTYLHQSKGWHAIVWEQTATGLTNNATLWNNNDYGSQADGGFCLFVEEDADANPNAFAIQIHRGIAAAYINTNTGANAVILEAWNYAIVSWEEGAGRDGMRVNLNGTNVDFTNSIFSGTPSANPPVLDIYMAIRAVTATSPKRISTMDIVELGAGNVGLTNAEINSIASYIQTTYAL